MQPSWGRPDGVAVFSVETIVSGARVDLHCTPVSHDIRNQMGVIFLPADGDQKRSNHCVVPACRAVCIYAPGRAARLPTPWKAWPPAHVTVRPHAQAKRCEFTHSSTKAAALR